MPDGLNLGAQLFWLDRLHPDAMASATLVPWAQYWAWFLSGVAVSEVSSLGCHTDLWAPGVGAFSPLAQRLGWAARFAPLVSAGDGVGTLRPELAAPTGLLPAIRIHAGLHDSAAALHAARGFAEIAGHEATVLSTGTWFIGMRLSGAPIDTAALPEGRFAEAEAFVRALATLRPDTTVYVANAHNDVPFGALRLLDPALAPQGELVRVVPLDADLAAYRGGWRAAMGGTA